MLVQLEDDVDAHAFRIEILGFFDEKVDRFADGGFLEVHSRQDDTIQLAGDGNRAGCAAFPFGITHNRFAVKAAIRTLPLLAHFIHGLRACGVVGINGGTIFELINFATTLTGGRVVRVNVEDFLVFLQREFVATELLVLICRNEERLHLLDILTVNGGHLLVEVIGCLDVREELESSAVVRVVREDNLECLHRAGVVAFGNALLCEFATGRSKSVDGGATAVACGWRYNDRFAGIFEMSEGIFVILLVQSFLTFCCFLPAELLALLEARECARGCGFNTFAGEFLPLHDVGWQQKAGDEERGDGCCKWRPCHGRVYFGFCLKWVELAVW